jgi:hypothetical protein
MRAIPAKKTCSVILGTGDKPQRPDLSRCRVIQNYYVCSVIDKTLNKLITEEWTITKAAYGGTATLCASVVL